ncbi:hypothetical protein CkaCkLH20_11024 [Colletotrichum karsti]|uniref:2EXR domain-containing protein n=1 Tax=Colletotrichum karsti TaxID=1095194 RepID=A0A9P6HUM3_9PEZI|nr:uncharacterized protein CkaCkLH20_11024 [Colletotrichum karsti]KAF9871377.1 hypothetical protein CkaCkLH20_11024 [Colletotrichum karsti]
MTAAKPQARGGCLFKMFEPSDEEQSAQVFEMSTRDLQLRTIALLEKIAHSQSILEGRVDSMEKMLSQPVVSSHSPSSQPTSFPQFRRLPPEIRHRVWSLALPTRALRLRKSTESAFVPALLPPAVAETCREARDVATLHGGMVSLTNLSCSSQKHVRTYWTWFDGRHDVLELERWVSLEADEPRGIRSLVSKARYILAPRATSEWFKNLFQQTTSLRQVGLKFDSSVASRCAWDPKTLRELFGSVDTVAILDLEDATEITRFKAALRQHWRCPFFCEFDIEGWAATRTTTSGGERDEGWMRRLDRTWMSEVARGWVMARRPAEDSAALLDVGDEDVRTALKAMPEVKLVRAYLLADVHSSR